MLEALFARIETAPATDGSASAPAETKVVPVALRPGGRAAVFADAVAAPVEEPSAPLVGEALAASARCKNGSAARMPEGAVAAFADTVAVPVAASDNAVETAASTTRRVAAALAGSALLCHVEHA